MRKGVNTKCTECGGIMDSGRIADQAHAGVVMGRWVDSKPEVNIWSGKMKNEKVFDLMAYRCRDCGFVKLYARDDV